MFDLKISKINKAHKFLKNTINYTPLITNDKINKLTNSKIYFKLENLQKTGSFKLRGAAYKISRLSRKDKSKGVVAYSSGNHAQGVAYAAKQMNVKATIVMPYNAPKIKIKKTKNYGATVVLYDPKKERREEIANKISKDKGSILIKPFDDIDIITGQGTVGKEIVEQLNAINVIPDVYICCTSGGGLIAGSSFYLKRKYKNIRCYSAEPAFFNDHQLSLKKKKIIKINNKNKSICDALLEPQPGKITFPINNKILNGGLSVSDKQIKKTIKLLAEELNLIIEPGGAVAAASVLNNKINLKNKKVVVVLSGSNIDLDYFHKIINEINE
ncbi:MAG: L-threonine ammonia-lyase [Alphaproteobacteria bacterium MarineAlpha5_Bin9]|nr:MAG: L-threonine ammonia-lyase [Alphaproteobacteria bacterium MarineAlpha5_Bin9]|tara:strand:+ start:15317 stop:16300 length:984 start_codon:yes stop_codon:yes gene_type:complete